MTVLFVKDARDVLSGSGASPAELPADSSVVFASNMPSLANVTAFSFTAENVDSVTVTFEKDSAVVFTETVSIASTYSVM